MDLRLTYFYCFIQFSCFLYRIFINQILLNDVKILFFNYLMLYEHLQKFKHITFEFISFSSHSTYALSSIPFLPKIVPGTQKLLRNTHTEDYKCTHLTKNVSILHFRHPSFRNNVRASGLFDMITSLNIQSPLSRLHFKPYILK